MIVRRAVVLVAAMLCLGSCEKIANAAREATKPETITSSDGLVQVTVPFGWSKDKLNDRAKLSAANRVGELYVIVITEAKEDLADMTIEKYSEITRGAQLKGMKNSTEVGPERHTIHGMPVVQYELRGTVDTANAVMIHASVEGKKYYYQVLAWTLKSKWDKEKGGLQAVIDSLTEVADAPAVKPAQRPAP